MIDSRAKFAVAVFLLFASCAMAQIPRVDFGARFEPKGRILTGAGQVDPADVIAYSRALDGKAPPMIFMDYVDVHTPNVDQFFAELKTKLDSLGWSAVPQIGLGMVDDKNAPYDKRVAAGDYDENIRRIAAALKRVDRPVFLRIGYEFHGKWNGYTPEPYVASFRRIVDALRAAGADNVATVWCAESGALEADYMKYYPGDDYVDWWAIDLFERSSFGQPNVEAFMRDSVSHRKPVMIGESTPRHVGVLDGNRSWNGWFAPYFAFIGEHANVKAFCYINWEWLVWAKRYSGDWADWGDARLQKNRAVRRHFRDELAKPIYLNGTKQRVEWWKSIEGAEPIR